MIATSVGASPTIVITTPGAAGVFVVTIVATDTSDLNFNRAVYDIEAFTTADALVYRIVEGNVILNKEATT